MPEKLRHAAANVNVAPAAKAAPRQVLLPQTCEEGETLELQGQEEGGVKAEAAEGSCQRYKNRSSCLPGEPAGGTQVEHN